MFVLYEDESAKLVLIRRNDSEIGSSVASGARQDNEGAFPGNVSALASSGPWPGPRVPPTYHSVAALAAGVHKGCLEQAPGKPET